MEKYLAFEVTQVDNVFSRGLIPKEHVKLKENHVKIKVAYSDVNYKDALASSKNGGVIREYPMIPGIDLAGEIVESMTDEWPVGKQVLVTGYGLGVTRHGGFSQYQQVPVEWLVALPEALSTKDAMIYGTAGFTAALAVTALEKAHYNKESRIVVTGASGGVGSLAIAFLHQLGYQNITAVSRKKEQVDWLQTIGATTIVHPDELVSGKPKALAKQSMTAIIDTVGGELLTGLLPQLNYGGSAYLCGNAGGIQLNTTVLPFILRGIQVVGIDSVNVDMPTRQVIWDFLATHRAVLEQVTYQEILLSELDETIEALLEGVHQGRTIVKAEVKP